VSSTAFAMVGKISKHLNRSAFLDGGGVLHRTRLDGMRPSADPPRALSLTPDLARSTIENTDSTHAHAQPTIHPLPYTCVHTSLYRSTGWFRCGANPEFRRNRQCSLIEYGAAGNW
jgi:hypothetical protein